MISLILEKLKGIRFDLSSEKYLQSQIREQLSDLDIKDEYRLTPTDIVDFFIDGLAIEVKIKGSATLIYRQCVRYMNSEKTTSLLLVTNKSMGFPEEINGKPCYVLNLGKALL